MRVKNIFLLLLIAALSVGLYATSFSYFKTQEIEKAAARLTLHRSTLTSELRHFAHLPFLLSLDPVVVGTLAGDTPHNLDHRLARFAQSAGVSAIYLMDRSGDTISASNAKSQNSFKGQNYGFRPYFQSAMRGELGEFYGIGATTGIPGYFYAMEVRPAQTGAKGVIAIKVDLADLQEKWQASGERIILANSDGVILLASDPDWRYRTIAPLSMEQRERIVASRQFASEPLDPLNWSFDRNGQSAKVGNKDLLYLSSADLPNSWTMHFFVPDDQAVARAWLATGAFLALLLLAFTVFQLSRLRRVRDALRASELEETELRSANARLAVEIDERRAAQQRLQKTQTELERAGRLAALGQLASSVTHELGQPIAAMRNQLTASEMTVGPTPLNEKMQGLVARMENITQQLKFFSRKGRDSFEDCDLSDVISTALELLEPSITNRSASIDTKGVSAHTPIFANKLRIEQAITNIVRNALDAVESAEDRTITITSGAQGGIVWTEISDTGHGLGEKSLDDLREPFATTRESGEGMGLGLTISAGIVTDHGGTISAWNRDPKGAVFRIELPHKTRTKSP